MSYPRLPLALVRNGLLPEELEELWRDLCTELLDPSYLGRTHQNRRTYDAGCKGPLCSKAVREHGRRRTSGQPNERYKYIDQILDYWKPIAANRIEAARLSILNQLTAS